MTVTVAVCAAIALACFHHGRSIWFPVYQAIVGKRTLAEVLDQYGPTTDKALSARFAVAGVPYPPPGLTLLAFKKERRLEVWAERGPEWVLIKEYEIKRASGHAGPKLREGDHQVPEGLYRITLLNPNSNYHLSLKLDYPNEFDEAQAKIEGRTNLGGDIFIHGKEVSIGCLAMGDEAIEELFVLASRVGTGNISVLIAPHDFRLHPPAVEPEQPGWIRGLYGDLERELRRYRR